MSRYPVPMPFMIISANVRILLDENNDFDLDSLDLPIPDEVEDEQAWQRPSGFTMSCKVANCLLMKNN